ncbi:putative ubiquitin-conjugating enzyme e2 24 [Quercus suber]|uniref:Ubiquitin-conjugating enzyme e2 24 n=1 Tax=Quercus suber TaxID=58331 RepID=A0AAW0KF77_QUESU
MPFGEHDFGESITPSVSINTYGEIKEAAATTSVASAERLKEFKQFDIVSDHSDHYFASSNLSLFGKKKYCFTNANSSVLKKIMQEWKILENNLPETIYVRVYDERMDLLRAGFVHKHFCTRAKFIVQACRAYIKGCAIVGYYQDNGSHSSSTIEDSAEFKALMEELYPNLEIALTKNTASVIKSALTTDMKNAALGLHTTIEDSAEFKALIMEELYPNLEIALTNNTASVTTSALTTDMKNAALSLHTTNNVANLLERTDNQFYRTPTSIL